MSGVSEVATAEAYFDRFAKAFTTFDGSQVADLFVAPGVALGRDGSLVALTTRDDLVRYYQAALDRYRGEGCRSARWSRLETIPMGRRSLLATVSWELLREDRTVARHWRQSYSIKIVDDGHPRTFASAMHAE